MLRWLACALLVIPSVCAQTTNVHLEAAVTGTTHFLGAADVVAEGWASFSDWRLGGAANPDSELRLTISSGRILLLRSTLEVIRVSPPQSPSHGSETTGPEQVLAEWPVGDIVLRDFQDYSLGFNAGSSSASRIAGSAVDLRLQRVSLPSRNLDDIRGSWNESVPFSIWPPKTDAVFKTDWGQGLQLSGAFYASGLTIQAITEEGTLTRTLGTRINTTRTLNTPLVQAEYVDHDYVFLLLNNATITSAPRELDTYLSATSILGTWNGELAITGAEGTLTMHEGPEALDATLVQMTGAFSGGFRSSSDGINLVMDGTASRILVDGRNAVPATSHVATIVAGGLLVALVAWLAKASLAPKVAFVLGRARRRGLENELRISLLEAVRREPGLTAQTIANRFSLPRGTMRFHVRRLVEDHLIRETRAGKRLLYWPYGVDDAPGAAVAVAKASPMRAHILEASAALAPAPLDHMSFMQWLATHRPHRRPISRSVFSYHTGFLVEAGLLAARRQGRIIRYSLAEPADGIQNVATKREASVEQPS